MYRFIEINSRKNMLLCSTLLVGNNELVEIHTPDGDTPARAFSNVLKKVKDPNVFKVQISYTGHETMGKEVVLGEECVLRILKRNLSGIRRRKFSQDEKEIVDLEKGDDFKERKVNRAKTGSVRKKTKKRKAKSRKKGKVQRPRR